MSNDATGFSTGPSGVSLLRELTLIETPSFDAAASERIARVLESHFTALGANVRLIDSPAGTNLVADFAGTGDPVLLVGHTDTVWPVGALSGAVPWNEHDGKISGPGTFDMKGGIVVMLLALTILESRPHRAVRILLTCDEEVGSPTTKSLLTECAAGAAAVLGFESPHPDGALKLGRRGSTRLKLHITGRAAHAALDPELGISAIDELVDQLTLIRALTSDSSLPSEVLCNVGTITGGTRANVVSDTASAELGLRFIDLPTEERVLSELHSLPPIRSGAQADVHILSHRPAWLASQADTALYEEVRESASTIGQSLNARPAAGAGDTNLLSTLGIPTLDGFGPLGAGAHATHEHIVTASLDERAQLLATVLSDPKFANQ